MNVSRRDFLERACRTGIGGFALTGIGAAGSGGTNEKPPNDDATRRASLAADDGKALVAITLDLEMSRHFPSWDDMHWDFEKGNLDQATKEYTVEACRRVRAHGGVIHNFVVGRVLEQENVDWLRGIAREGHPIGNHTYDHVNVRAATPAELQFRFRRAPWLIEGQTPAEVIRRNIAMTTSALERRVSIENRGFRTPGGFHNALDDRADLQKMLLDLGFEWVSSKYPRHPYTRPRVEPDATVVAGIVEAQVAAQPFVYPSGLVEVPMSPPSDVVAMRTGRWRLESFLRVIRAVLESVIEKRMVFDFLAHPSCLCVMDPELQTIELICELVRTAGTRAALVDLDTIAERARIRHEKSSPK